MFVPDPELHNVASVISLFTASILTPVENNTCDQIHPLKTGGLHNE